jgi:magnesium chelatase accessory protein
MSGLSFSREGADWPLREASRFVEAGGFKWHVQELGHGPPLLALHGTGGATHSWRGLAPLLAPDFRWLAPDLPGHGFTTSRHRLDLSLPGISKSIAALIAKLAFAPRVVVGHSAGAAVLAHLIAHGVIAPDLFVAINGAFLPFEGWAGHVFPVVAKVLELNPFSGRLFAWSADRSTVQKMLTGMGSKLDARGVEFYARLMRDPAHCAGALGMMANWNLREMPRDLGRVKCPMLLIVGVNDRAVSPAEAPRVAKMASHATVKVLPGVGHLAHEEQPETVAALIRAAAAEAGVLGLIRNSAPFPL